MKRDIYGDLLAWKNAPYRKPLILNGARQVGKTYILQEFGKREFRSMVYFSLDRDSKASGVFDTGGSTADILLSLSAISGTDIVPGETLVVLDEVQSSPKALEAMKFFCEDAPDVHVVVAGSLLGLALHSGVSWPVGKVDELRMYPMTFAEFLSATGNGRMLALLEEGRWSTVSMIHGEYISLLRQYYYVGGMPAAVRAFVEGRGLNAVRRIQQQIVCDYRRDFSKYAPTHEVPRINMVWESIPAQLAKENKKFIYGALKKSGRAAEFEMAIQWLVDAGLVYKVARVNAARLPLKFYEDPSAFKLFMLDVGLMGAMARTTAEAMLVGDGMFSEYKGAFTELYVFSQLEARGLPLYYHSVDNSTIELDFLTEHGGRVVPIEVKAEVNVKAKSLRTFIAANPHLHAIRYSMLPYDSQEWMTNVPLYAVGYWKG